MFVLEITANRIKIYATKKKGYSELKKELPELSEILYLNLTSDEEIRRKKRMTRYQRQVISKFHDWFSEYFWIIRANYTDSVISLEVDDPWFNNHIFN